MREPPGRQEGWPVMKNVAFGAYAGVLAALAGCASSSSTNPLLEHSLHGTLTCQSLLVSGHTLGNDITTLASDNQAISGQWAQAEAAATSSSATPTAAQDQAITDLTATLSDLGTGTGATGKLAATVSSLDTSASRLTTGAAGWRSAGPVVGADIAALAKSCGAAATVPTGQG